MSDNIYRVLMGDNAPFLGMANTSYLNKVLRGVIKKVYYKPMSESSNKNEPVLNQYSYRKVDVEMLEGKPCIYSKISIPELVSFKGYGLNYLPSVGDTVLVAFDSNNSPIIVNIISRCAAYEHGSLSSDTLLPNLNEYGDVKIDDAITESIRPTPIRYIKPGEISLSSLNNNSELYFDEYGTAKLISRDPVLEINGEGEYINGLQCGNRLWEISVGQDIYKETEDGHTEIKKSSFGNNVQYQILGHQNDCKVDFDSEGNIEVNNKGNNIKLDIDGNFTIITSTGNNISLTNGIIKIADKQGNSITMNSSGIQLGDNANFSAVLGESLNTLLQSMISIFNSHTHIYSPGGGTPTPTAPTVTPMTISDILSKTIKLKQ